MNHLIILDDPNEWPISIPGVEIYSARDYLTGDDFRKRRNVKIYNLCKSYHYQTLGYYVSLLAAARGHKPLPSVSTIQDLKSQPVVQSVSEDLDRHIQKSCEQLSACEFVLNIYFGQCLDKQFDRLTSELFKQFQSPLLQATFKHTSKWELKHIEPISALDIPKSNFEFVERAARVFFTSRRIAAKRDNDYNYDLAILVDPNEANPPSNTKALQRFIKAAAEVGIEAELITANDYSRIAEFDALFIRETTSVNHHTFRFARRAKAEGLIVIDDPDSILKCTNKIYLAELLETQKMRTPRTLVAHRHNVSEVERIIGFPCILKQPDSAFSLGVKKAIDSAQLMKHFEDFLSGSDLLIAQEFLPTEFDWRLGIIDRTPFYACRYFMAKNHWQNVKQQEKGSCIDGRVQAVPFDEVPEIVVNTALKAANLIGDGLYGVDLKQIGSKCYIIEVNDNPNIDAGFEDALMKMDIYRTVMRVFRDRLERKKPRFKGASL